MKEKPSAEIAQEYINRRTLLSAGVFAFKLGYLISKSHEIIDYSDYNNLFNRYEDLSKIRFDYAVVEKKKSVQIMLYLGEWKNIGTWNMLSEVITEPFGGNALLDETCSITNVINEIDIPALCIGLQDYIISVLGDRILVTYKERRWFMKT